MSNDERRSNQEREMSDINFCCPNCGSEFKHLAGMTYGEIMALRHDKMRLSENVVILRESNALFSSISTRLREENEKLRAAIEGVTNEITHLREENEKLRKSGAGNE